MRNSIGVMLVLIALLSACGKKAFYEKHYSFDSKEWNLDVKPKFEVEITDTSKLYNFVVILRTTTGYKYNNLWIYLNTKTPDGQTAREPYEIRVANPDGSWIGKNTGTVVENTLLFSKRKLPVAGTYVFSLEQGITESEVDQVLDIGLRVDQE